MKLHTIILLSILGLSLSYEDQKKEGPTFEFVEEWSLWKAVHSKNYASNLEELEKHLVWLSNKVYVENHNINAKKGFYSYEVKLNHLADLTDKEYHDQYLSYRRTDWKKANKDAIVMTYQPPNITYWPTAMDWRTRGAVTRVKDQAGCGASYAFATTGVLEGTYALTYDRGTEELSEQNLIDCTVPEGNNGCHGGNMYNSFMYIIFNDGIDRESSYRYQGIQNTCNFTSKSIAATMSGIIVIKGGSEYDLHAAVTYSGPVAAAVDAQTTGFKFYSRGVFSSSRCSSYDVNHAMVIVGYGTSIITNGITKDYWILKNSWGEDWGDDGYIWMSRNSYNQCGIATDCSYPSL